MYKIAYKVVKQYGSCFFSSRVNPELNSPCDQRVQVEYIPNQWVEAPENTRLFVFETLDEAKSFKNKNEVIFVCLIHDYVKFYPCAYPSDSGTYWNIFNRFKTLNVEAFRKNYVKIMLDTPSVLAKKVMLLEKVA